MQKVILKSATHKQIKFRVVMLNITIREVENWAARYHGPKYSGVMKFSIWECSKGGECL